MRHNVQPGHPDWGRVFPCRCRDLTPEEEVTRRRLKAGLSGAETRVFESFEPREGTSAGLGAAQAFARSPQDWLVLAGGRGVGKTHLALAIAEALVQRRMIVKFGTVAELLERWRSFYSPDQDTGSVEEFYDLFQAYCQLPCIVVDDLGAERPTPWAVEHLGMLLDYRSRNRLPTVITSNFSSPQPLADHLGEGGNRIADRVFDRGTGLVTVITFNCPSYRTGQVW